MKNLILAVSAIVLLTSCSKVDGANPSQNRALNSVSGNGENKKSGHMQQALDSWLTSDWTPSVEKNESVKKRNEDDGRDFTLQEYVDKMALYNREHNSSEHNSHKNKLSSMPVIGVSK